MENNINLSSSAVLAKASPPMDTNPQVYMHAKINIVTFLEIVLVVFSPIKVSKKEQGTYPLALNKLLIIKLKQFLNCCMKYLCYIYCQL